MLTFLALRIYINNKYIYKLRKEMFPEELKSIANKKLNDLVKKDENNKFSFSDNSLTVALLGFFFVLVCFFFLYSPNVFFFVISHFGFILDCLHCPVYVIDP